MTGLTCADFSGSIQTLSFILPRHRASAKSNGAWSPRALRLHAGRRRRSGRQGQARGSRSALRGKAPGPKAGAGEAASRFPRSNRRRSGLPGGIRDIISNGAAIGAHHAAAFDPAAPAGGSPLGRRAGRSAHHRRFGCRAAASGLCCRADIFADHRAMLPCDGSKAGRGRTGWGTTSAQAAVPLEWAMQTVLPNHAPDRAINHDTDDTAPGIDTRGNGNTGVITRDGAPTGFDGTPGAIRIGNNRSVFDQNILVLRASPGRSLGPHPDAVASPEADQAMPCAFSLMALHRFRQSRAQAASGAGFLPLSLWIRRIPVRAGSRRSSKSSGRCLQKSASPPWYSRRPADRRLRPAPWG